MRIAVISDIHANLEAFTAVLNNMRTKNVHACVCLGDVVGYGADPEPVLQLLWSNKIPSILGNHEEAVYDDDILNYFNPQAKQTALLTRKMLKPESAERIKKWPVNIEFNGALGVHGFPPDSIHKYLFEADQEAITRMWKSVKYNLCFVGHTHSLDLVTFDGHNVIYYPLGEGGWLLDNRKTIVNVGSVGQPRDGDNHAKYVIWDTKMNALTICYVPYDIQTAANKILKAGFPEINARRLY
ncbi:MAG: metallophosphoesterase family protein [Desulfatibacillum sp.]|nr:metallophosphoesterase family protein [Desulfatibacillum sp.]